MNFPSSKLFRTFQNLSTVYIAALAAFAATTAVANPEVSGVTMYQNAGSCKVTVSYTLSDAAVVTLDILTNAVPNAETGWTSIGGEHICNATGEVWKRVAAGTHTITWQPAESWLDGNGDGFKVGDGCAVAEVTAWPLDNTPDYMVVDISAEAQPNTQRYYPRVDFLPGSELGQKGAVTNNPNYKSSLLLMRKIMAKDVTWTMGSTALESQRLVTEGVEENTHQVALTNNYYIGVFEVTQSQWSLIKGNNPSEFQSFDDSDMHPVEKVRWTEVRLSQDSDSDHYWPNPPNGSSFLGRLRTRTGIDFDLPGEAQWEFAARAGNGDTHWGDGTKILNTNPDGNLNGYGWYSENRTGANTVKVGSYRPNAWGLYDMAGNVFEWCLDWYQTDISAYNGRINVDVNNPSLCIDGTNPDVKRVRRGGSWKFAALMCRPAARDGLDYRTKIRSDNWMGFRVACQAGLK